MFDNFHFHKWHSVVEENDYNFEGTNLKKYNPTGYRCCSKCNKVQLHHYDFQGGSWETLSDAEAYVIMQKIENDEYMFKPEYVKSMNDHHITNVPMFDLTPRPKISDEEISLKIIKGGLQSKFGIEFDTFMKTYHKMLKESPEKFI